LGGTLSHLAGIGQRAPVRPGASRPDERRESPVVEEMDLDALLLLIRAKIADGRLPAEPMPRVWGGPGNGETCDACDQKVEKSGFVIEGRTEQGRSVVFHPRCFYTWQQERGV